MNEFAKMMLGSAVRYGLGALSGWLGYKYGITPDPDLLQAAEVAGVGGVALGWSIWEKRKRQASK